MGKSSASLKRKRYKNSSKAKASSRSKSRKYKSGKVRRREVSLSSAEYDDSKSLNTSSSSSSEDSSRSRRDRSRTRKDVKARRKRARRRSYSRDSSEDSLHARKRKKVKRKNEYETREKPFHKKKLRKEASVSSMSGGPCGCSTCQGVSAISDDSQFESRKGRLKRKEKDKRRLERGRSRSEKSSRYRARSCSSCSPCGESSDEGAEVKYIGENSSRWLRSVITATKEAEECGELCRNETKEEIVDDHDYPCRSNDSNDGGTKTELDHHTVPASEEKLRVEDEIGDVNADYNIAEPKIRDRSYNDGSNVKIYGTEMSGSIKKKNSETFGANLSGDDLESILRQRALENLRKFRGEIHSTAKASDQESKFVSSVKQPITEKHELVQGKSIVNNEAVGTKIDKKVLLEETYLPVGRRDLITYPKNNERILNMDKGKSGSVRQHLTHAPEKVIDSDNPRETISESTANRTDNPELTAPESCHDSLQSDSSLKQTPVSELSQEKLVVAEINKHRVTLEAVYDVSQSSNDNVNNIKGLSSAAPNPSSLGPKFRHNNLSKEQDELKERSQFELKQTSASHEPPYVKFLVTEGDVENNAAKTTQAAIQSSSNNGRVVDQLCNSATPTCFESSSVENSSAKLQDECNQSSQFEQKKMNVMRGGEMVQVSYKVYIPKKAPALARRQLKR